MNATTVKQHKSSFLLIFSRLFIGFLFVFSGLIKANDPIGFSYKLQEYFEVFHVAFLNNYAVAFAIVLCSLEIVLGVLLLFGLYSKKVALGLLLLILFFTFLTFYSAFFNVVTSCGCFGDAIKLTPWQSFSKDLILLFFILIIFLNREKIQPLFSNEISQALTLSAAIVLSIGIGVYTYSFLPFIDFLPYKEGNNLPALMHVPKGAPLDEYEITYTLQNKTTKETKSVTDKVYLQQELWKDENWEVIGEPTSRLIKEGYQAPIKDLSITDAQGVDYTKEIIENPYYNLIFVAYNLDQANPKALNKVNDLAKRASEEYNVRAVLLTASTSQEVSELDHQTKLYAETFFADAVPLKSMVRANPGIMLLKDGVVVKKWHYRTLPTFETLAKRYFEHLD